MKRLIVLSLVLCAGCAVTRFAPPTSPVPELVSMSTLPSCVGGAFIGDIQLDVIFEIRGDGTVAGLRMLRPTIDPAWDRAAMEAMSTWRFAPVPSLKDSATLAVRTRVNIRPEERLALPLGTLRVTTESEADSLYTLLRAGASFDSLAATARWDSPTLRGSYLGVIDIGRYPFHVRQELRALRSDRFTPPLRVGSEYMIFKCFSMPL